MKFNTLHAGIAGLLLAAAISGCDKNSSNAAMDDAKKTADSATTAVQQGADKAVGAVTEQVKAAGGEATAVIAKAQGLVADKKYQEALTTLGGLKDVKLTDTQQKVVDELKAQVQKLMSGSAAGTAPAN